jgi:Rrf2 family protein
MEAEVVSAGTKYGLRFAVELALRWGDGPMDAASAAKKRGIPESYLRKIASALRKAGIVAADRGQAGGYRLNAPPSSISVLDIYDALETPSSDPTGFPDPVDAAWDRIEHGLRETLAGTSLEDISRSFPDGTSDWNI